MPNATEETVFNFFQGQYPPRLGHASFDDAVRLYPLKYYANSFSLQGQQMYGECSVYLHSAHDHWGCDHEIE